MDIDYIKTLVENEQVRTTYHFIVRLRQRNITIDDTLHGILNGEIIEEYPTDYPYPSCLILGMALNDFYIHVVCGIDNNELWLITAYKPTLSKWADGYKVRKGI